MRAKRTSFRKIIRKIIAVKMDNTNQEIVKLIHTLEDVLSLLDEGGYSLPAVKVEEAVSALRQLEKQGTDADIFS